MGIQPPFMYDAVGRESTNSPFTGFNFKGSPRAPKPPRPNYEAPFINSTRNSFISTSSPNRQSIASTSSPTRKSFASGSKSQFDKYPPDSYSAGVSGKTDAKPMKPSTKMVVTRMRIVQLVLRCLELLGSVGLLVITIMITNIPSKIGLIIRIPPGIAILHTAYGIYHLARRPSGRTPGSSASYMLFAAAFDVSLLPFYGFAAILSESQHTMSVSGNSHSNEWGTLFTGGGSLMPTFSLAAFLLASITGSLHLLSLFISIWLGVVFRKISRLPPDMNPLEDNLTSRHSNRSSSIIVSASKKRLSEPLESKRSSGAAYENLLRPPTVPFHHNRNGSVDSLSTYHPTPPPSRGSESQSPARDLPRDLPSRQYQITPSPRSSLGLQTQDEVSTRNPASPSSKRSSYTAIPLSDDNPEPEKIYTTTTPLRSSTKPKDAWFGADSLVNSKKPAYEPIAQQSFDDFDFSFSGNSSHPSNTNSNYPYRQTNRPPARLSYKIPPNQSHSYSHNQNNQLTPAPSALPERYSNRGSVDITSKDLSKIREESRDYSSFKSTNRYSNSHTSNNSRDTSKDGLKAKYYGDLRPGTPPIMVGTTRQISTGADIQASFRRQRDVSGKIAEEGRAGGGGWGERLRRISGRA